MNIEASLKSLNLLNFHKKHSQDYDTLQYRNPEKNPSLRNQDLLSKDNAFKYQKKSFSCVDQYREQKEILFFRKKQEDSQSPAVKSNSNKLLSQACLKKNEIGESFNGKPEKNKQLKKHLILDQEKIYKPNIGSYLSSYSATNQNVPMFGQKGVLIQSMNGSISSKFNQTQNFQGQFFQEKSNLKESNRQSSEYNQKIEKNDQLEEMSKENLKFQDKRESIEGVDLNVMNSPKGEFQIPNHEPTKCSYKDNGIVKGYAANTNQGLVRKYNEDRVAIILNIMKPASRINEDWPKCSFFGVYDGHGGVLCADFLRDHLHQFVVRENCFPYNPVEAIKQGFQKAEKAFLDIAKQSSTPELIERSGSCAIVVIIVGNNCYIANVGDSRAVLSSNQGQQIITISRDHKPQDEQES